MGLLISASPLLFPRRSVGHKLMPEYVVTSAKGEGMRKFTLTAVLLGAFASVPALAALSVGAKAPDFTTKAALGGKEFTFSLADALKKGPVVLYFFPAAFTPGCTLEAHDFAEATDRFAALG